MKQTTVIMKIRDDINAKKEDRSGTKAKQETISM
jgi:hypothetical protein